MSHSPDFVTQQPGLEPADSEQIANPSEEPVSYAIFRDASTARTVTYRNLDHAGATKLAERGKKSMRAHEERQVLKSLPAIRLERATNVGDGVADHGAPNHVRDPRGGAAPP